MEYVAAMYRPPAFREDRSQVLYDAIRAYPLGMLITGDGSDLLANVIPFTLRTDATGALLRAHLSKANEQTALLRKGAPVLVVFQGPQAYISPSWYPSKQEHGQVVPTWNYVIVQVRGTPVVIDDRDWLRDQIEEMTSIHEAGRPEPWGIDDAPKDFIAGQLKGILGLEIPIQRVEGKWKVSQNQPEPNRCGVELGLRHEGNTEMANEVAARRNVN